MVNVPLKVTSTKKKGDYEIRSYSVKKLNTLEDSPTLTKMLQLLDYVGAPILRRGEALGLFNGTTKFRVAFKDDKPVAVHMKGDSEGDEGVFNKKFGKKGVFGKEGGGLFDRYYEKPTGKYDFRGEEITETYRTTYGKLQGAEPTEAELRDNKEKAAKTSSGLNVKGGRTKRNRRGRKGGKTRKLATWCS